MVWVGSIPMDKDLDRILIDDSGVSCPIGGVLIGAYDFHTKKFLMEEVEVKYFQNPLFEKQIYFDIIADTVMTIVKQLNRNKKQTIKICRGHYFKKAVPALKNAGFEVEVGIINEPLQSLLKRQHYEYKVRLGYPLDLEYYYKELGRKDLPKEKHDDLRKEFRKILTNWVKEDISRIKLCKSTGADNIFIGPCDDPKFLDAVFAMYSKRGRRFHGWYYAYK